MWVFTNRGFFSIVVPDRDEPAWRTVPKSIAPGASLRMLLVRARRRGQIETVFGVCVVGKVIEESGRDYRYRALVERENVARVMRQEVERITYGNFKNSCKGDYDYKGMLGRIWNAHFDYQSKAGDPLPDHDDDQIDFGSLPGDPYKGFKRVKSKPPILRGNRGKGRR
jgi:hypothetical protein